ncbi:hypothetical protein SSPS47_17690 [Streptomyces sp. S4.7]|uniref:DUF397 domain-containing protein n=1 Tax=Streptomyces sp. S4.7 TaxID=2705439 RepID=UPI001397479A|nr:DUF397 domain-containing protein [Streptomyces sp. S4.7]QHY96940.1 hypothetical protein SSPS47_17690 [Streptomyces sp. S4.7]
MLPRPDLSTAQWRKSSYSNGDGGDCVEVADAYPGLIPVRDSKTPTGPVLLLTPTAWSDFVAFAGGQTHA